MTLPLSLWARTAAGWCLAALLGIACGAGLHFCGVAPVVAAQATAGIIGLGGGLSFAWLFGASGGGISGRQRVGLAALWSVGLLAAVTPPFFLSGDSQRLMAATFCSFAFFGACCTAVTVCLPGLRCRRDPVGDPLPAVAMGSFSFGLAAGTVNIIAETLQGVLPDWLAWGLAFAVMAFLMGMGGACALGSPFGADRPCRRPPGRTAVAGLPGSGDRPWLTVLVLLCIPFYLNDFSNIYVVDWRGWLWIDSLAVKAFPLLVVWCAIRRRYMDSVSFGLSRPASLASFFAVFYLAALGGILIDQNGYALLQDFPGYPALGSVPRVDDPLWRWIDLTAGLFLVALSEEMVFRGYLLNFLSRYNLSAPWIVVAGAVAFGLIHWSGGLHQVMVTALAGALFMALFMRTRSLPALVLAHWIVDVVAFADVVPASLFRLL